MDKITHAGGVIVRIDFDCPRYLVVQAAKNPDHWVLPKGHLEPAETPTEAVLREIREEAGVRGEISVYLDALTFKQNDEIVHANFYIIKYLGKTPRLENRALRWCTYAEALNQLSFEESRRLLRRANEYIERISDST